MHAEALPYWGKARPFTQGADAKPYHLLTHHCLDVAAVGIRRFLCELARNLPLNFQLPQKVYRQSALSSSRAASTESTDTAPAHWPRTLQCWRS